MQKTTDKIVSTAIDKYIADLTDWRGKLVARLRILVHETAPELTEEWKWDIPVWSHNGIVVAVGAFKNNIKINFFKGASLKDPQHLFNAGLEAKKSRAIDIFEHDDINETALKELIKAAVELNTK